MSYTPPSDLPKLKTVSVVLTVSTTDSTAKSDFRARRPGSTPMDVVLNGLDELVRVATLYGYGDEVQRRVAERQQAVYDWVAANATEQAT